MRGVLLALVVVSSSCATTQAVAREEGPSPVVAKFGDKVIRLGEVDKRVEDELSELNEQIYKLRTDAADRIAVEALVSKRALAEGLTEDAWLQEHVESQLEQPSDDAMRTLFDRARKQIPEGVTFDDAKPQLRQVLLREARTKKARDVFAQLKREVGYQVVLEAPAKVRKQVEALGPSRGNPSAKVVIIEFADFECSYCARAHETVQAVLKAYGDQVRLVFRHYPLSFHPKAPKAAEATACADEQGKFWELHDLLFESQALELDALKLQAQRAGVDLPKFEACLDSGKTAGLVVRDQQAGQRAGVSGTPAFFINGIQLSGAKPEEEFRQVIDAELARLGD